MEPNEDYSSPLGAKLEALFDFAELALPFSVIRSFLEEHFYKKEIAPITDAMEDVVDSAGKNAEFDCNRPNEEMLQIKKALHYHHRVEELLKELDEGLDMTPQELYSKLCAAMEHEEAWQD